MAELPMMGGGRAPQHLCWTPTSGTKPVDHPTVDARQVQEADPERQFRSRYSVVDYRSPIRTSSRSYRSPSSPSPPLSNSFLRASRSLPAPIASESSHMKTLREKQKREKRIDHKKEDDILKCEISSRDNGKHTKANVDLSSKKSGGVGGSHHHDSDFVSKNFSSVGPSRSSIPPPLHYHTPPSNKRDFALSFFEGGFDYWTRVKELMQVAESLSVDNDRLKSKEKLLRSTLSRTKTEKSKEAAVADQLRKNLAWNEQASCRTMSIPVLVDRDGLGNSTNRGGYSAGRMTNRTPSMCVQTQRLKDENSKIRQQFAEKLRESDELKLTIKSLEFAVELQKDTNRRLALEKAQAQARRFEVVNETLEQVRIVEEEANEAVKQKTRELEEAQRKNVALEAEHTKMLQMIEKETSNLNDRISVLRVEKKELKKGLDSAHAKIEEAKKESKENAADATHKGEEKEIIQRMLTQTEATSQAQKKEIERLTAKVKKGEDDFQKIEKHLEVAKIEAGKSDEKEREKKALADKATQLEKRIVELEQKLKDEQIKVGEEKKKFEGEAEKVRRSTDKAEEIERDMRRKGEEHTRMQQEETSRMKKVIDRLEQDKHTLTEEANQLRKQIEEEKEVTRTKDLEVEETKREVMKITSELKEVKGAKEIVEARQKSVSEVEGVSNRLLKEAHEEIARISGELANVKREKEELKWAFEKERDKVKIEIEQRERLKIDQAEAEKALDEAARADAMVEIEKVKAEVGEKEIEIGKMKAEVEEKELEIDKVKAEVEEKKVEIEARKAEIEEYKAEIEGKKSQIEEKEVEVERARAEIERLKAEVERMQSEADSTKTSASGETEEAVEKVKKLMDGEKIKAVEEVKVQMRAQMDEELKKQMETKLAERMDTELKRIGEEREMEKAEYEERCRKVKELEDEAETAKEKIERLEQEILLKPGPVPASARGTRSATSTPRLPSGAETEAEMTAEAQANEEADLGEVTALTAAASGTPEERLEKAISFIKKGRAKQIDLSKKYNRLVSKFNRMLEKNRELAGHLTSLKKSASKSPTKGLFSAFGEGGLSVLGGSDSARSQRAVDMEDSERSGDEGSRPKTPQKGAEKSGRTGDTFFSNFANAGALFAPRKSESPGENEDAPPAEGQQDGDVPRKKGMARQVSGVLPPLELASIAKENEAGASSDTTSNQLASEVSQSAPEGAESKRMGKKVPSKPPPKVKQKAPLKPPPTKATPLSSSASSDPSQPLPSSQESSQEPPQSDVVEELAAAQKEAARLREEVKQLEQKCEAFAGEIEKLKGESSQLLDEKKQLIETHKKEIKLLQDKVEELKDGGREEKEMDKKVDKDRTDEDGSHEEKSPLKSRGTEFFGDEDESDEVEGKGDTEDPKDKVETLRKQRDKVYKRYKEQKEEIKRLTEENADLLSQLQSLNKKAATASTGFVLGGDKMWSVFTQKKKKESPSISPVGTPRRRDEELIEHLEEELREEKVKSSKLEKKVNELLEHSAAQSTVTGSTTRATSTVEHLSRTSSVSEESSDAVRREVDVLRAERDRQEKHISEMAGKLLVMEKKVGRLSAKVARAKSEVGEGDSADRSSDSDEESVGVTSEGTDLLLRQVRENLEAADREKKALQQMNNDLSDRLAAAKAENSKLVEQLKQSLGKQGKDQKKSANEEETVARGRKDEEEEKTERGSKDANEAEELKNLQKRVRELEKENDDLKATLEEVRGSGVGDAELKKLKMENDQLSTKVKEKEEEVEKLKELVAEKEGEIEHVKTELKELKVATRKKIDKLKEENAELEQHLKEQQDQTQAAKAAAAAAATAAAAHASASEKVNNKGEDEGAHKAANESKKTKKKKEKGSEDKKKEKDVEETKRQEAEIAREEIHASQRGDTPAEGGEEGGWGYFNFSGAGGEKKTEEKEANASAGGGFFGWIGGGQEEESEDDSAPPLKLSTGERSASRGKSSEYDESESAESGVSDAVAGFFFGGF